MTILSCSSSEIEEPRNVPHYSVDSLVSALPELTSEVTEVFDSPKFIEPYYLESFLDGGYVAANDRTENLIHLFSENGTHLDTVGGEGRGPGEFLGAIRLYSDRDKNLYALDLRMNRITRFSVNQSGLSYDTSYSPNLEPGSWLQNVYVTEWGQFGVVRSILDHSTGEDTFHLYKLDDTFNQTERLLEMPGNEKMSLGEFSHIDHIVGKKTLWDLDGEWFYHISSHSPIINRYNLRTEESTASVYYDLEEREVTGEKENHLKEFASNMIDRFPEVGEEIITVKSLPFFEEFLVRNNTLYLVLFDIKGREQTEIIRINEVSEEVHYIDIPLKLWRIKAGNGMIYGIDTTENSSLIQIIDLEE